jgi:hypothetical protein
MQLQGDTFILTYMKTRIFLTFLLLALLCAGCFIILLPYITDTYLFPRVMNSLPFSEKKISLSKISPWKLRGTVHLADDGRDILSLPGIEFNFTPKSILKGKVHSILIDGGTLHLNLNSLKQKKHDQKQQTSRRQNSILPLLLPISFDTLIIKNSAIVIHQNQNEHHLFINGRLAASFKELDNGRKQFTSATTSLQSTGALTFSTEATLQPKETGHELLISASSPDISQFKNLYPEFKKISPEGQLALSGTIGVEDLLHISDLQITAHLTKFKSAMGNIVFTESPGIPIAITMKKNREKISSEIKYLSVVSPLEGSAEMQGEYDLTNKTFTGAGQITIETISLPINFSFSGDQTGSGTRFKFSSSTDSFSLGENPSPLFSPFSTRGELNIKGGNTTGNIHASVNSITLPAGQTEFQDISLFLPLQFPLSEKNNSTGTFKIGSVNYNSSPSGSIKGKIDLNSTGVTFSSHITSPFGPDLQAQCSGSLTMDRRGELNCHLPRSGINSASFPPYIHLPPDFSFEGSLSAEAEFSSTDKTAGGRLLLQVNDGTMIIAENKLTPIDISVTFPNLPLLQSAPSQLCSIGSIELGNVKLSNAKVYFRLESPQSLFVEKSTFAWCGGKVESGGFRLLTTGQELEATLYCDRLNFTQLLGQFGIEDTEGEGSLNGKLPILLSENSITFDDGFLFSTPGNGGIIRFNNTSQLRQGIGAIDQTPYLDYSMQALENFAYNWTKLTFNSQEEDLLIKMQIDGKPAVPLPFGYKKGQIIPTEKGPGLQHPILLDVNFRLPIAHFFEYGRNMQSIMENM